MAPADGRGNAQSRTSPAFATAVCITQTNSKGFAVASLIKMWGHDGTVEAQLHFDRVRVEPHRLVGELDHGFKIALSEALIGRC